MNLESVLQDLRGHWMLFGNKIVDSTWQMVRGFTHGSSSHAPLLGRPQIFGADLQVQYHDKLASGLDSIEQMLVAYTKQAMPLESTGLNCDIWGDSTQQYWAYSQEFMGIFK